MKQILVVAGVITDDDGHFLMAQRCLDDSEGGKWEFPGGKVEAGEDPRVSLVRELKEELRIVAEVGALLEVVSEIKGDSQLILLYFKGRIIEGIPTAVECQRIMWLKPAAMDNLIKPKSDQRFWERFKETLAVDNVKNKNGRRI